MNSEDEEKRKTVIGILTCNARTGATLKEIDQEYQDLEGKRLAPTKDEALAFMQRIKNSVRVRVEHNITKYYPNSDNSKHVTKLIEEQNETKSKKKTYHRPLGVNFDKNKSFPSSNRSIISYADVDNQQSNKPMKIFGRRKSFFHPQRQSPPRERLKRRNSTYGERSDAKRFRSKSASRWSKRSPSPRNSRSPVRYPEHSHSRSRSPHHSRSRSPRRHLASPIRPSSRLSRSPPNDRPSRKMSPNRKQTPDKCSQSPPNTNSATNSSTPMATQSAGPSSRNPEVQPTSQIKEDTVNVRDEVKHPKTKKFKFTVVGDGFIYYMMSKMQDETKHIMPYCNHTLTFAEVYHSLEKTQERLKQRKKKVLISLGATDLRKNRRLFEMKRDFTKLFLLCNDLGLKPLVTTVSCFDTPELKRRSDIFNQFLMQNFENVIDMDLVGMNGLCDLMSTLNNKNVDRKKSLQLGTQHQLVLNIQQ